jgi:hypothetical protein
MGVPKPTGPAPKAPSKRRRVNTPASYGLAEPTVAGAAAPQPELGFAAHELIISMWAALAESVESRFYSHADWQRFRLELWYANKLVRGRGRPSAPAWTAVQNGLSEMLVSPADKRRAGIELKAAADPDAEAAVLQIAKYQDQLAGM